jgi:regulator of extracellular matrix RemA (YlzA/DUF370 family)
LIKLGKFYIPPGRVIAVLPIEISLTKKLRETAGHEGKIIDLTYGKKTRSAILMDSGHVILSSMNPKSVVMRIWGKGRSG